MSHPRRPDRCPYVVNTASARNEACNPHAEPKTLMSRRLAARIWQVSTSRWMLPSERKGNVVNGGSTAGAGEAGNKGGPRGPHAPTAPDPDRAQAPLDLAALEALEDPARDGRVARGQRTRRN